MTFYNRFNNLNNLSFNLSAWNTHTSYVPMPNTFAMPSFSFNSFLPFNFNFGYNQNSYNYSLPVFNFISPNTWFQNKNTTYDSFNSYKLESNFTLPTPSFTPNLNTYSYSNTQNNQFSYTIGDTFTSKSNSDKNSNLKNNSSTSKQLNLCNNAKFYIGKVNSDSEGNRLFSPNGRSQAWCADFVTYVTKKTYGNNLPKDFGSSSVYYLRDWGINNNCYKQMPSSNKADFIAQNIKPGDIMIEKQNGKSHTGIVTKVNSDGSFETVEGNASNKVKAKRYEATSDTLSGFISLDKYS